MTPSMLLGKRIGGTIMVDAERQRLKAYGWHLLAGQNDRRTNPVGGVPIRWANLVRSWN